MTEQTFSNLVDSLAARTPTPASGAAAPMTAAVGEALLLMAVRFSRGKKANLEHDAALAEAEQVLARGIELLEPLADRDGVAFEHVGRAYRLPKDTADQVALRDRAIEEALFGAMATPEETLCLARDGLAVVAPVATCIGRSVCSDLGSGAEIVWAAAEAAYSMLRSNAAYLRDRERAGVALARVTALHDEVTRHHAAVRSHVDALIGDGLGS